MAGPGSEVGTGSGAAGVGRAGSAGEAGSFATTSLFIGIGAGLCDKAGFCGTEGSTNNGWDIGSGRGVGCGKLPLSARLLSVMLGMRTMLGALDKESFSPLPFGTASSMADDSFGSVRKASRGDFESEADTGASVERDREGRAGKAGGRSGIAGTGVGGVGDNDKDEVTGFGGAGVGVGAGGSAEVGRLETGDASVGTGGDPLESVPSVLEMDAISIFTDELPVATGAASVGGAEIAEAGPPVSGVIRMTGDDSTFSIDSDELGSTNLGLPDETFGMEGGAVKALFGLASLVGLFPSAMNLIPTDFRTVFSVDVDAWLSLVD